ncbi:hypothetical protein BX070DRAFT_235064 [Coemansia spiralis]|nr:hypothetical protein BX070DRAFT_235064 [Coemansia spiralis]
MPPFLSLLFLALSVLFALCKNSALRCFFDMWEKSAVTSKPIVAQKLRVQSASQFVLFIYLHSTIGLYTEIEATSGGCLGHQNIGWNRNSPFAADLQWNRALCRGRTSSTTSRIANGPPLLGWRTNWGRSRLLGVSKRTSPAKHRMKAFSSSGSDHSLVVPFRALAAESVY